MITNLAEYHAQLATKATMSVRREEYLDHMTFQSNDRPLFTEIFGPLLGLKEEWRSQGASTEELDLSAFRFRRQLDGYLPINTGWLGGKEEIISEDDETVVAIDHYGRTVKLCKNSATLPLPMTYPVATMEDWLAVKEHYSFSETRFGDDWQARARQLQQDGYVVSVSIPGGFDEPRQLMGEEALCLAFYDQPELIFDMLQTIGDTCYQVLERVSASVQVDQLFVHEDMAGKSGSLIGPQQIREFILPYYRKSWDLLTARGARLFSQDSDGNMDGVIHAFLDAGINVMYPMEPASGMDIVKTRQQYGEKLAFLGGIDKHVLRSTKEEIRAELEYKIPPMVKSGGCVLGLDHRIPNGTPLENYRFYIKTAWEILERESAK